MRDKMGLRNRFRIIVPTLNAVFSGRLWRNRLREGQSLPPWIGKEQGAHHAVAQAMGCPGNARRPHPASACRAICTLESWSWHVGGGGGQIEEEIGIPRSRLEVVRAGRPQLVGDGNRRFAIYPFLFKLVGEDVPTLRLNWESVDARWVTPGQLQVRPLSPIAPAPFPPRLLPHVSKTGNRKPRGVSASGTGV